MFAVEPGRPPISIRWPANVSARHGRALRWQVIELKAAEVVTAIEETTNLEVDVPANAFSAIFHTGAKVKEWVS
jgi:hypothetical protein